MSSTDLLILNFGHFWQFDYTLPGLCDDPCSTVNYMHSNPARQWGSVTRSGHGYYMSLVGGASLDLDWVPFKKLSL